MIQKQNSIMSHGLRGWNHAPSYLSEHLKRARGQILPILFLIKANFKYNREKLLNSVVGRGNFEWILLNKSHVPSWSHLAIRTLFTNQTVTFHRDFAVNRTIAVEVRRLNQNERGSDSPKGLEEVERPLLGKLKKFLESFGLAEATGWWVLIRFKRPVPRWERIEHDLRHFFLSLEDSSHIKKITKRIGNNFEIELLPKTPPIDYVFELGAIDDLDEGGSVI